MMLPIVRVKFGSHLYGTATETSDTDFKGVHLPDGRDVVLQRVKPVLQWNTKSARAATKNGPEDVDEESYALHKFLSLVAQGDMMATELLFAPPWARTVDRPAWALVLDRRDLILNRQCAGFVGYCRKQAAKYGIKGSRVACARDALALMRTRFERSTKLGEYRAEIEDFVASTEHSSIVDLPTKGQPGAMLRHWEVCGRKLPYTVRVAEAEEIIQRLVDNYGGRALAAEQNQGVDWKAVSHAVRVAEQAVEMLTTGLITFPRPNAPALLEIKRGLRPYKEVSAELEVLLDRVEDAAERSSLSEQSDAAVIDDLVHILYREMIA